MQRDTKRMFKVIVTGGISLVSVGSLVALGACGSSDSTSTGGSSGLPHEGAQASDSGPITQPSDSGNDTGGDAQEPYDAGDAGDAFPPII
ncbi:MAG TPA: hypothetical protein VIF62_13335 [Labilithrix sp.]